MRDEIHMTSCSPSRCSPWCPERVWRSHRVWIGPGDPPDGEEAAPAHLEVPQGLEKARDEWANCGPTAVAASSGLAMNEVRDAMPKWPGYTNVSYLKKTLDRLGLNHRSSKVVDPLRDRGIVFVQFKSDRPDGQWGHWRLAYRNTHWISISDGHAFDVNLPARWVPWEVWVEVVPAWLERPHGFTLLQCISI